MIFPQQNPNLLSFNPGILSWGYGLKLTKMFVCVYSWTVELISHMFARPLWLNSEPMSASGSVMVSKLD